MHGHELIPLLMVVLLIGLIAMAYAILTEPADDEDDDPVGVDVTMLYPYSYRRDQLPAAPDHKALTYSEGKCHEVR